MNRYTFKGKNKENGEWVYGSLLKDSIYGCVIVSDWETVYEGVYDFWVKDNCAFEIIPETLCQCTGLQDIEGNYIFENDIITFDNNKKVIEWKNDRLGFGFENEAWRMLEDDGKNCKIIGNKFDKGSDIK